MPKFMCQHTLPPHGVSKEQVDQMAAAIRKDPVVRPYRSFFNLAEGKVFCIMEAPNPAALANCYKKLNLPYDFIAEVELEGEYGAINEVGTLAHAGA